MCHTLLPVVICTPLSWQVSSSRLHPLKCTPALLLSVSNGVYLLTPCLPQVVLLEKAIENSFVSREGYNDASIVAVAGTATGEVAIPYETVIGLRGTTITNAVTK